MHSNLTVVICDGIHNYKHDGALRRPMTYVIQTTSKDLLRFKNGGWGGRAVSSRSMIYDPNRSVDLK